MKLLGIVNEKKSKFYQNNTLAGYLFPLKDWSVDYQTYFTLQEIKQKKEENKNKLCFVIINRMMFNQDLQKLENALQQLEKIKIDGLFYYDNAVLQIVTTKKLQLPLFLNKTHMVTNSNTLNLYYQLGLKGAYLSNEITLEEIKKIRKNTNMILATMLVGYPVVATSHRALITNYAKVKNKVEPQKIEIKEPVSQQTYFVEENMQATSFHYGKRLNASSCYKELKEIGIEYGILVQDDFTNEQYMQLVEAYQNENLEIIDKIAGKNRGFLYRKTIYRVK